MTDPPLTPPRPLTSLCDTPPHVSPFRARVARTPQAPIAPFSTELASRPFPAGDYLIVAIRANDPDRFVGCRIVTSLAPKAHYASCVYIRLHSDCAPTDDNPEPRVDWLELYADGIRLAEPAWEVAWAPQADKDKCMWLHIADVFDIKGGEAKEGQEKDADKPKRNDPDERKKKREGNQKVIDALRKVFDDAGRPTVDGYRLGESAQAVIVLAYPAHVDAVLRAKTVTIGARTHAVSAVRQIEVERPFEIAVRGFAAYPESRARQVCDGWFDSFRRPDGTTLLAETRAGEDVDERDYMFYTMADWATTELVLGAKSCESFIKATATFHLQPPQLLYNVNSAAAWKTRDAATAIDEGAKKIDSGLASIARRMEVLERQAQSRHDATEARMGLLETTLTTRRRVNRQYCRPCRRAGSRILSRTQHTHLTIDLLRINNDMTMARRTIAHPFDDDDKAEAIAECKQLKAARADVQAKLDALRGNTNGLIVAPPGPTIAPPPLPPRSSTPTPGPSNKRPRISLNGPDPEPDADHAPAPAPSSSASAMEVDDEGSVQTSRMATTTYLKNPASNPTTFIRTNGGVTVGIRKNIQIAQCVAINAASLRGRVVAVDIVLPTTTGQGFVHRMIGAYAPWDPGAPDTRDFWPDLTALVNSTTTSWSVASDLNTTVSTSERASGGANARAQYLKFLTDVNAIDIWSNHPERNRHFDWTSRAGIGAPTGNIIDRVVTSKRQYVDAEIAVADRSQDFVPSTNHRAVAARIQLSPPDGMGTTVFPTHQRSLNATRIKFPTRAEKSRHEDFRAEIVKQLETTDLYDVCVTDDVSFTDLYQRFTNVLIPASEKAYGRINRNARRTDDRVPSASSKTRTTVPSHTAPVLPTSISSTHTTPDP
ncbi:hypothetical protein B0H14DRAFT_2599406 [Mycena olivaceomarginata]|nr:hypothetical protein B0H14DRAFT_2599406 [Mycena olivaceomarginata]